MFSCADNVLISNFMFYLPDDIGKDLTLYEEVGNSANVTLVYFFKVACHMSSDVEEHD